MCVGGLPLEVYPFMYVVILIFRRRILSFWMKLTPLFSQTLWESPAADSSETVRDLRKTGYIAG